MKKLVTLLFCLTVIVSCKKEAKTEKTEELIGADSPEKTAKQSDGLTLLKGDFVYFDGAAVLQTHADIYGVFVTDKMHELNKQAEVYKKVPTDMVQVEIRGKITDKKDEQILWEQKVEIIEILKVSPPKDEENDVVKLGS
ncbi:hypothetical protein [Hyunsoonleella aestuarii]|uniref:NlpE C-terminal OB domain-containing protein n=1 Tax=Hyunsoonleella aestuarii TaxID=912802 RepID=A0ABP8E8I8_9FLAO|nr:hypothetical protein [Hyunsoonleella aestuarii]